MKLNKRQVKALQSIVFESRFLEGDFAPPGTFGTGVGEVTLASLVEAGLLEKGPSSRHHGAAGYRPTELGKEVENTTY